MDLRLPLQDANGHWLKIGGFASNFPASSGKKINIRGFLGDIQKGNFEFSAQTDCEIWEVGAGSKPGCRLMLLVRSPAQMLVDGGWLMVELV